MQYIDPINHIAAKAANKVADSIATRADAATYDSIKRGEIANAIQKAIEPGMKEIEHRIRETARYGAIDAGSEASSSNAKIAASEVTQSAILAGENEARATLLRAAENAANRTACTPSREYAREAAYKVAEKAARVAAINAIYTSDTKIPLNSNRKAYEEICGKAAYEAAENAVKKTEGTLIKNAIESVTKIAVDAAAKAANGAHKSAKENARNTAYTTVDKAVKTAMKPKNRLKNIALSAFSSCINAKVSEDSPKSQEKFSKLSQPKKNLNTNKKGQRV